MPDRILGGLTLRQLGIGVLTATMLWLLWASVGRLLPTVVFGVVAGPVAAAGVIWILARPNGAPLERLAAAAIDYARMPRRRVLAPDGLPARPRWLPGAPVAAMPLPRVTGSLRRGCLQLGREGHLVVCHASPVNLALRSLAEQQALISGFARLLNALEAPVQFLVRTRAVDLSSAIGRILDQADGLSDPALQAAAREHAIFLTELASRHDVAARDIFVCFREPAGPPAEAAASRLARRVGEAASITRGIGVRLQPLDAAAAVGVLAGAGNPAASARLNGITRIVRAAS